MLRNKFIIPEFIPDVSKLCADEFQINREWNDADSLQQQIIELKSNRETQKEFRKYTYARTSAPQSLKSSPSASRNMSLAHNLKN